MNRKSFRGKCGGVLHAQALGCGAGGFTLIEVLVVAAIIALLVAVLLPSLARARAVTRVANCTSNLHQMGLAMNVFATEHKGRVPRGISRHGGGGDPTGPVNWVRMVARQFGDKSNYAANFNRVPVEKYAGYSCPERARDHHGAFLDYVINSTDHRGPIRLGSCTPDPMGGLWYEAEGVTKLEIWEVPGDTIYIMDAIEESWNISDANNYFGTMRGIRENINLIRSEVPPTKTGYDWFDVAGGRNFPTYKQWTGTSRFPRAAIKMHVGRGSVGVFVDGHAAMIQPPPERAGEWAVHEFYMRKFGVNRRVIKGSKSVDTTATSLGDPCASGDTTWRP